MIDSKDILIAGEGDIDLGRETIDLRLIPKPRRASPISTAATVLIKGPLTNPVVRTQAGSLVTSTTAALVENIGSVTGVRWLSRTLRGKSSEETLCAQLDGGAS